MPTGASHTCPGCLVSFTRRGFMSHLRMSTNLRCKAVLQAINEDLPSVHEDLDNNANGQPDIEDNEPGAKDSDVDGPRVFGGDFFGQDYDAHDFPGFDGQEHEERDGDEDDGDDDEEENLEYVTTNEGDYWLIAGTWVRDEYWEAPLPDENNEVEAMDDGADQEDAAPQPPILGSGREAIETALHQHVVVDHYPFALAGAPIAEMHEVRNFHHQYGLRVKTLGNPYAPFASRLDWEVARWAKLRGTGFTAVSELFGIAGVSCSGLILNRPLLSSHLLDPGCTGPLLQDLP